MGAPNGMTIAQTHLYVVDGGNMTLGGPAIFVFDKNVGSQKPQAIISGQSTLLNQPSKAAIGP
jgi:hypothetical protein